MVSNIPPTLPFGTNLSENVFWDIYDKCMEKASNEMGASATKWIHLADAVSRGTITPLEAYDVFEASYFPECLTVRESLYSHLL